MTAYCVHARAHDPVHPHRVEAEGFVAAALAYAERWLPPAADGPLVVDVEDEETGEQRCLTLDLDLGEARPCG